jgi:UDP-N-acetylmuramoylalanine--D-glutamate ligase
MRILGKGKTALSIQKLYKDALIFDDKNIDEFDINSKELTVVSPGIPPTHTLVKNTKNLISEYDLFSDVMPYNIWISGTNGKTTTTKMLQHILKNKNSQYGGNIGIPLATMDKNKKIWILETSSYTLHYTNKAKPNIYVLLPIGQDHITWHGSFNKYEKAKLKPLNNLKEGEIAIIPRIYKDYPTNGYKICYDNANDLANEFDIDIKKIKFKEPFLLDALLALAVSKILFDEVNYQKINTFKQDSHKLEEFKDKLGRIWVNDSKATNIQATILALKKYKNKKIFLILGGDDKGVDLTPLFEEFKKYQINIFGIGTNTNKLNTLAIKYNIKFTKCFDLQTAIVNINKLLKANEQNIALLSPACASFDQFNCYEDRGNKFKKYIYEDKFWI